MSDDDLGDDEGLERGPEPIMLADLAGDGVQRDRGRGYAALKIRPVASATVIGIGGTGIQIISRLRTATLEGRSDQHALNAVSFLGIDAVDESSVDEQTPLPPGVTIGPDLFTMENLKPGEFLKKLNTDAFLREWWDTRYKVPSETMTDGLKRERMLGRLCFYENRDAVVANVREAMGRAAAIQQQHVAQGQGGVGALKEVYLVCSCAGGTGSSGFLEVLMAVHQAARDLATEVRIRAFILLPNVFSSKLKGKQNAESIAQAQRANAYAFFKELDHYLVKSSELPRDLGRNVSIDDNELLYQAFLIDANLGAQGIIREAEDTYEITSEAIFQFLFTEMGRALVGVDGTNFDRMLQGLDAFEKPRRYCSLGIARLVFPGDTYRKHLRNWWLDRFVQRGLRRQPTTDDISNLVFDDGVKALFSEIDRFVSEASTPPPASLVQGFLEKGREATEELAARPTYANAKAYADKLIEDAPVVTREVRLALESLRPNLLQLLREEIEASASNTGGGLPIAQEIVRLTEKAISADATAAETSSNSAELAKDELLAKVKKTLNKLEVADKRNLFGEAWTFVAGLVDDERLTAKDAAQRIGQALKDWSNAVVEAERRRAQRQYLEAAAAMVAELTAELTRADAWLLATADAAAVAWTADDLIGKDAGPAATSVLLPADVSPQVEDSLLSRMWRDDIRKAHGSCFQGEPLQEFVARWRRIGRHRGFFDLGSANPVRSGTAARSLLGWIEQDAERFALRTTNDAGDVVNRLPADLLEAARLNGGVDQLVTGITGIKDISKEVCWEWSDGLFSTPALDGTFPPDDLRPRVTTAIASHPSIDDYILPVFGNDHWTDLPDPERAIALSCEWAVPLHTVKVVSTWRDDYDQLASRRESQRRSSKATTIEPPSHIDKRMESLLPEPIPDYSRPEDASPRMVKALIVDLALGSADTKEAVKECFVEDFTRPPVSPVRRQFGVGFTGRIVNERDGELHPTADDVFLGKSLVEATRALGADLSLSESVDTVWKVVVPVLGMEELLELVGNARDRVAKLSKSRPKPPPEDQVYLGMLLNALAALQHEIEAY